jgi:hypothetical protein
VRVRPKIAIALFKVESIVLTVSDRVCTVRIHKKRVSLTFSRSNLACRCGLLN